MNRFILASAVAIALVGPVYAGNLYRPVMSTSHSFGVAAGEIAADGGIERGSDFTVRHLRQGVYAIRFDPGVAWFNREVAPKLDAFSLKEIGDATGLSLTACSRIRGGSRSDCKSARLVSSARANPCSTFVLSDCSLTRTNSLKLSGSS